MKNINFGIDLGTTNSGIGRYENGKVQVLKNPVGLSEILPSVVSFYRGRILVGSKAREQYLSNSGSVFSAFKRKMGTSETYNVVTKDETFDVSPVDLSAYVLKELSNYVQGSEVGAAVITIPASFDTIQSNATKNAGYKAGFAEVVLLQEPIAACLAYANLNHINIEREQKWLVYDFGGGTFDVALVYINHRELKVLDNKGNNFLGGVDIDHDFILNTIVPKLEAVTNHTDIAGKLMRKEGVYEKFWYYLNYLAEEAKKELSLSPSSWIEVDFDELDIITEIEVTQEDLNRSVAPRYHETEQFILNLLADNSLAVADIERIVLVGGTTYIPYIKDNLRAMGIKVDDSIDPTTAVIVGAAYYAGSHQQADAGSDAPAEQNATANKVSVKLSFEAYSNDHEELIAFKVEEPFSGFYRLTRTDGGFDSGLKTFNQTGSEFVALLPKSKNTFKLSVLDGQQKLVYETAGISISQGLYSVSGQLLPEDICIELDGKNDDTYLEVVFKRNSILPLKRVMYKTFSKSIIKDTDDKVIINVVEGKSGTLPGSNLSIGYIEISGSKIISDLIQGTDIEIQLEMDESRGLKVDIYIPTTGQELSQSFHIANREISLEKMFHDIELAEILINKEIADSNKKEIYELSSRFKKIADDLESLKLYLHTLKNDQVTEEKYRADERKRKLLSELDQLTRARDVFFETNNYNKEKKRYLDQEHYANAVQKTKVGKMFEEETEMLRSGDKHLIKHAAEKLKDINDNVRLQNDEFFIGLFWNLAAVPENVFVGLTNRDELIEAGKQAINDKQFVSLKNIVAILINKLPDSLKKSAAPEHIQLSSGGANLKTGLR